MQLTYMQQILKILYVLDGVAKNFYFWQSLIWIGCICTALQQFECFIYLKWKALKGALRIRDKIEA